MKSIGLKLTVLMLCVILIGIIITVGVSIIISDKSITSESLERVGKTTELETGKLDKWLIAQSSSINATADFLRGMDGLAEILTSDQSNTDLSYEDQTVSILRPLFKSVLEENEAYFEVYMGFSDGTAVTGSGYQFNYATWTSYERGWYKLAMTDTNVAHITAPYVDAQTGQLCITVVRAVYNNGKFIGVMSADIFVTELTDIIMSATLNSTGYSMLIDSNGDILIHPDKDYAPDSNGNNKKLGTVKNGVYSDLWNDISKSDGVYQYKDENGTPHYFYSCTLSAADWHMISVLPTRTVTQPVINLIMTAIPITVAVLLIAALLIYMMIRNLITRPLAPLTSFMTKAGATGDLRFSQEEETLISKYSNNNDEIGRCMKGSIAFVSRLSDVGTIMSKVADGDLTTELSLLSDADEMGKSLQLMESKLNSMFGELNNTALQVSSGAKQVADGAQSLAQGSTEQAESIQELSNSITVVAQKTKVNSDMAGKASMLADTIRDSAVKGSKQMDDMINAVEDINKSSQRISKVIKVIDDIAFQTNILALNAAVEAARAGQHGKGFAVVAEEVRNLASKSAEAAKDTGSMIQDSMVKAEQGARIAGETAESLTEIVTGINESTLLIAEIAQSSEDQLQSITQINVGIDQVAQVVQQNSAVAEEEAAASEEMSGQSSLLQELTSHFKLKDFDSHPALSQSKTARRGIPSRTTAARDSTTNISDFGKY